jgi:hypothetical protein
VAPLAAIASIATTMIAGHHGDNGKDKSVLRQGVLTASIIDLARLAAATASFIILICRPTKRRLPILVMPG